MFCLPSELFSCSFYFCLKGRKERKLLPRLRFPPLLVSVNKEGPAASMQRGLRPSARLAVELPAPKSAFIRELSKQGHAVSFPAKP